MLGFMVLFFLFGSIYVMHIEAHQVVNGNSVETLNKALESEDDDALDKHCDSWDQSNFKCLVNLKIKKLKGSNKKPEEPVIAEVEELAGDDEIEYTTPHHNTRKHPSHQFFERQMQLYELPPRSDGKKSLLPRDSQRTATPVPSHQMISEDGEMEEDDKVIFKPKPPYKLKLRKEFQPS